MARYGFLHRVREIMPGVLPDRFMHTLTITRKELNAVYN